MRRHEKIFKNQCIYIYKNGFRCNTGTKYIYCRKHDNMKVFKKKTSIELIVAFD